MFRIQKKKNQPNKTGGQTLGSCSPHRSLPDTSPPAPGAALSPSYGSWGHGSAPRGPYFTTTHSLMILPAPSLQGSATRTPTR